MKKRTRQLDDAKEVLLGYGPKGPIHSTVGDLRTTPEDKGELQDSVNKQYLFGSYLEVAKAHKAVVEVWMDQCIGELAPGDVVHDYMRFRAGGEHFQAWIQCSGFHFHLDGLDIYLKHADKVIKELKCNLPEKAKGPVLKIFQDLLAREAGGMN